MACECTSSGEDGGVVYCSGCARAALEVAIGLTTGPQCVVTPVVAEPLCRGLEFDLSVRWARFQHGCSCRSFRMLCMVEMGRRMHDAIGIGMDMGEA